MKRLAAFLLYAISYFAYSQCPPAGQLVVLSSQEKVNKFIQDYGTCENIIGDLMIISAVSTTDDDGAIGTEVNDISGLNFLKTISGKLIINVNIEDITGFSNLISIGQDLEITNSSKLTRIAAFNNLQSARNVTIALNPNLNEISGFESLRTLTGSLEIGFSDTLVEINGFSELATIEGELNISNNLLLEKIPSFNAIQEIGEDLNFTSNQNLLNFNGLTNLITIHEDLNIEGIRTIFGFENLKYVYRDFEITKNTVESIPSFNSLEEIGGEFKILDTSIKEIIGFNNLRKVGHLDFLENILLFSNNMVLETVLGFGQFILVDGNLEVINNPKLSDCTWLCNIINNGKITGDFILQDNLNACSNVQKIIEICDPDFDDDLIADVVDLDDDNDGILDVDEGNGILDTDGDGFPDSKDLDSDNDDCFDVIEAGFSDPNSDGTLGDLPDEVNFNGLIINESTGYTTPKDDNTNGIKDFQEVSTRDPGKNNIVEFCPQDSNLDLLSQLNGTPEPGGTWSPALASGTNIFNPLIDQPGIYTYTHYNPICGDRSAQLMVSVLSTTTAGESAEIIFCDQNQIINLFDALGGNPTPGGQWTPELSSGSNIFNPNIDKEGVYKYTIVDRFCGAISSTVNITKNSKPNAGIGKSIQICEFSQPINLFEILEGNPDDKGFWVLDSNSINVIRSFDGVFDPKNNISGKYIYTVNNGSCGVDRAEINVEVLRNNPLNNVTIKVNDFSAKNNSIQIFVASEREYEYSLDGINYQMSSTFNQVKGGYQTVYVRGVDGCEFYEETVFVKSYPPFFTPNNDGNNDFWRLDNFPDINYQIYIYTRFGKLVKKIPSTIGFWDGTYEGRTLESSDYWFKVVTEKGEVFYGNFSLLRK